MTEYALYNGTETLKFTEGNHSYWYNGKRIPSVTGIIGIYDKPALLYWAVNQCGLYLQQHDGKPITADLLEEMKKEWRRVRDDAAQVGTDFHAFAESVARGEKPKLPEGDARMAADAFLEWAKQHHFKPIEIERKLLSRRHMYAGTVDLIAYVDGELSIIDYKTSKAPKDGKMYDEWKLQLAAYSMAYSEETGAEISRRIIARFPKTEGDTFETYEATDHQFDDEGWMATLAAFRWKKGVKAA